MSADNITYCPRCGEHALREWIGMGWELPKDHAAKVLMGQPEAYTFRIEYRCECRECLYEWAYANLEHVVVTP